uniref:Uncharacterized protein n=1 Tax=Arion vulgaris TaxID=1028688 RepID=A0A0B6ZYD1_9EUPU
MLLWSKKGIRRISFASSDRTMNKCTVGYKFTKIELKSLLTGNYFLVNSTHPITTS